MSMVGVSGYGYGVPLSYAYTGDALYCHCALEGEKIENLRRNNGISFCVVKEAAPLPDRFSMRYESAIVSGRAREVEGEEKLNALLALVGKYCAEFAEKGREYALASLDKTLVMAIDIEQVTGKARK